MTQYSGKEISRAGDVLIEKNVAAKNPSAFERAIEILSYWRACHDEPLNLAVEMLTKLAQKHDPDAVIAKRLKRTPSIVNKLRRFPGMKLRKMQDIGGCRAILANEKRVRKLVRDLKKIRKFKTKDYIQTPKDDGYRSIHLVGDFSKNGGNVRTIELQVRTAAQHAWATAVEIIDLFTGQAIKSNQGKKDWLRFFQSASEQFAIIENIPLYNQLAPARLTTEIYMRLKREANSQREKTITKNLETLHELGSKLDVLENFEAYANSLKVADDHFTKESLRGYVLLQVDINKKQINSALFKEEGFLEASDAYLQAEKTAATSKGLVVALVSTDAVGGIKEAFPNYFADSTLFAQYVSASIQAYSYFNPGGMARAFRRWFGQTDSS